MGYREGLVLERSAHNVSLQQGAVEFRDLDGWKDGLSFSLEQRFQEAHTDQGYDYLKGKASSGNQIIGLLDYCHFYYLIDWDSGTIYIDELPSDDPLGIFPLPWEDFCELAYTYQTGPSAGRSGGRGLAS